MKKWIVSLSVIVLFALASIYIFIPSTLNISGVMIMRSSKNAAYRFLSEENNWRKWWPDSMAKENPFAYKDFQYTLLPKLRTNAEVLIQHDKSEVNSTIDIIPLVQDSLAIRWKCAMPSGWNPVNKILRYREATRIKENMDEILGHFQKFMENPENVYGIQIRQTSTADTLLICIKSRFNTYPTTADTYQLVNKLKKYIAANGARQTSSVMRNITALDSGKYQMMVAIPVDKPLQKSNDFFPTRMVPGHFLVTEVRGGPNAIENSQQQIRLYMDEYKRMSMAIPFESLITDRSVETDTSKWVTKLFNPVF